MRILIEIGHPAHVHFFKRAISRLENHGHFVLVTTRNKDITNELLDRLNIPYHSLSRPSKKRAFLLLELAWRWLATCYFLLRYRISRSVSISGITTSLPSKICGISNLVFTDTEDAKISNWIAFPFADQVLTPDFYLADLGPKQIRYSGLHELAYLQDFDFEWAAAKRRTLGLPAKYFIIRMVKNDALHDWDIEGLSVPCVERLIDKLKPFGQVFVTSEGKIHPKLESYRLQTPLADIHAVLEGALLFIGESPTMAVESSLLGTPAFLMSQRSERLGNMVGLEKQYQLLRNFPTGQALEDAVAQVSDFAQLKEAWSERAANYRTTSCDMDDLIIDAIVGGSEGQLPCAA